MVNIFESDDFAAFLQIDTSNAVDSLNRNIFLHNITIICPEISNCNSVLIVIISVVIHQQDRLLEERKN